MLSQKSCVLFGPVEEEVSLMTRTQFFKRVGDWRFKKKSAGCMAKWSQGSRSNNSEAGVLNAQVENGMNPRRVTG